MTRKPENELPEGGALYIKGELDHLTGDVTPYFKVGIVRGDKDAISRDKALKTGNPRAITNLFDLEVPFVQKVETRLHNEFARGRVSSGEWFHASLVTEDEVQQRAIELQRELNEHLDDLIAAADYSAPGPSAPVPADGELVELANEISILHFDSRAIANAKKLVESAMRALASKDESHLGRYFKRSERAASSAFSSTELKKRYPELHAQFMRTVDSGPQLRLSLPELDIDPDDRLRFWSVPSAEIVTQFSAEPDALHELFLACWSAAEVCSWERWIKESIFRARANRTGGIENFLYWEHKTVSSFDKEAFLLANPEIVPECTVGRPATTNYSLAEWHSFGKPATDY